MTKDEIKRILRVGDWYKPSHELLIETAIGEAVNYLVYCHQWSWRKTETTFTITGGTATVTMPSDVDAVLDIVYDTDNRTLLPLPHYRINEMYDNASRSGSLAYYYTLHNSDAENIVLEIVPTPTSSYTATMLYLKRINHGDVSAIPIKLHGLVLMLAKDMLQSSSWTPQTLALVEQQKVLDKPIIDKKWNIGLDGKQASRINDRNSLNNGVYSDTTRPYA